MSIHITRLAEIQQDLKEFQQILSSAVSPRVSESIKKQIASLKSQLKKTQATIELQKKSQQHDIEEVEKTQKVADQKPALAIIYTPLTKYSWQDQSKKVKIYFSLENIGPQVPAQNIDIDFKTKSVELKIRNYRKQNLIFAIKPTFGEIIPEQCKYLQKTNLFSITLTKKSSGTWTQLNFKEDKFKADKKEDNADPNASLMNMMKKMYEEGDDTMKKTIAEAWTKSKDKKGEDAFKLD